MTMSLPVSLKMTFVALVVSMAWAFTFSASLSDAHGEMYDQIMSMPSSCIKAPPVHNNYTLAGRHFVLKDEAIPDILVYETGNLSSSKIIIGAYDISGFTWTNTRQVADIIGQEMNVRVVLPDYFRGEVYTAKNPNPSQEEIAEFVDLHGDFEDSVYPDTMAVIRYYNRTASATSYGYFGWCWGGKITALASIHISEIKVSALVHPGNVETEEAPLVQCPMYIMLGSNDADMTPFYEILQQNFGIQNTGLKRFDLPHSFAGANVDFDNATIAAAVDEVITTISQFFGPRLN